MMGYAYTTKAAASSTPYRPPGWPAWWPYPGQSPPSWPKKEDGSLDVTIDSEIVIGDVLAMVVDCWDEDDNDTDVFDDYQIKVTAESDSGIVQLKALAGDDYADEIYVTITNYSGAKYGFSGDYYFDLSAVAPGEVLTVVCEVYGAVDFDGSNISDVKANLIFDVEPTAVTRGVAFSLTVQAQDFAGDVVETADAVTVSLPTGDENDVLYDNGVVLTEVTLVDGVWASANVSVDGGAGIDSTTIGLVATGYVDGVTSAFDTKDPVLVFTVDPGNVTRDTNFSFTLQAQDHDGNKLDVSDAFTITLTGADASDVFTSPAPDSAVISGTFTAGEWATTTEQITGGAGSESGVTLVAAATGYTGGASAGFAITLAAGIYPISPTTMVDFQSHSWSWFSGSFGNCGAGNAAGWQAEWDEAHIPTVDVSYAYHDGVYKSTNRISVGMAHAQKSQYGWKTLASLNRSMMKFDISVYKGSASSAVLRITPDVFGFYWDTTQWLNDDLVTIRLYSISGDLSGAKNHDEFIDIYTKCAAGSLEDSNTIDALKTQNDANGYMDIDVSANAINNASGDYVYLALITDKDYADSPFSYPGVSVSCCRPSRYSSAPITNSPEADLIRDSDPSLRITVS